VIKSISNEVSLIELLYLGMGVHAGKRGGALKVVQALVYTWLRFTSIIKSVLNSLKILNTS